MQLFSLVCLIFTARVARSTSVSVVPLFGSPDANSIVDFSPDDSVSGGTDTSNDNLHATPMYVTAPTTTTTTTTTTTPTTTTTTPPTTTTTTPTTTTTTSTTTTSTTTTTTTTPMPTTTTTTPTTTTTTPTTTTTTTTTTTPTTTTTTTTPTTTTTTPTTTRMTTTRKVIHNWGSKNGEWINNNKDPNDIIHQFFNHNTRAPYQVKTTRKPQPTQWVLVNGQWVQVTRRPSVNRHHANQRGFHGNQRQRQHQQQQHGRHGGQRGGGGGGVHGRLPPWWWLFARET